MIKKSTFRRDEELRYRTFSHEDLATTRFEHTLLTRTTMLACNLSGAHFVVRAYQSNFPRSSFAGAHLAGSAFYGCSFRSASLRNANLTNATFDGTSFAGADLTDADLTLANLVLASDLTARQIVTARNWRNALLDPQVRREAELLAAKLPAAAPVIAVAEPVIHIEPAESTNGATRVRAGIAPLAVRPESAPSPRLAATALKTYRDIVQAPVAKRRIDRSPDDELTELRVDL